MGDLNLSDDVLRQTAARFAELAREAGLVVPVSLDAAGSPMVVKAGARAEQWYRGAVGVFAAQLARSGWQASEVADAFSAADRGISDQAAT